MRRSPSTAAFPVQDLGFVAVSLAAGAIIALMVVRVSPLTATALVAALLIGVAFLASPWVALLTVVLIRASTDLSYSIFAAEAARGSIIPTLPNIGLILMFIVAGGMSALRMRGFSRLPAFYSLFFLLAVGTVGMLRAPGKVAALAEWLAVLGLLVIYLLSANLPSRTREVQRVITVLLLSAVVPSLLGLFQLVTQQGFFLPEEQVIRIYGTFVHPNAFGIYLVLLFGVLLAKFVSKGTRRITDVIALGLTALLLGATFMRAAWVGAAAVVGVIGLLRARWLLILFPLLAVVVVLTVPGVAARTADPLGSGSFTDRLDLWAGTYKLWHREVTEGVPALVAIMNWTGGLGPGAIDPITERLRGRAFAAHNDYLRVLVEYGVLGIVLYLVMIISLIRLGYRAQRTLRDQPLDFIPLAFLAVTVAYSLMSLTDNVFGSTQNQVYYWTLAGLSVATQRLSMSSSEQLRDGQRGSKAL